MAPLPACFPNNGEYILPHTDDSPLIIDPPENVMSGPEFVSNGKQVDGTPVPPKRKRGRPKKTTITAKQAIADCGAINTHSDEDSGPARRLRSRTEQHQLTPGGNTCSELKLDPKQSPTTPTALHAIKKNKSTKGVKRGRPKLSDRQIPAQVSKLAFNRQASSSSSGVVGGGARAEADKQGKQDPDKQKADTTETEGYINPRPGVGKKRRMKLRQGALPQRRLRSKMAALCTSQVIPSQCQPSQNFVSPRGAFEPKTGLLLDINRSDESKSQRSSEKSSQTIEARSSDVINSQIHGQLSKSVKIPSNVKAEDIEMELDHFNSISQSNSDRSLQSNAKTTVKSECPNSIDDDEIQIASFSPADEQHIDRGKSKEQGEPSTSVTPRKFRQNTYGRSRYKRKINLLLNVEPFAVSKQGHEGNDDPQRDCDDSDKEGNSNSSFTTGRGKAPLKCKDCGRAFKFLSQYIIHRRIHTGERPFTCHECGKGFTKNSNLNLHLKTHRRTNAYQKCPHCKIKFSCSEYSSHMKIHSRTLNQESKKGRSERKCRGSDHDGSHSIHASVASTKKDSKQVCQYCGKTFPFRSALIRHVRVHTGEKPYKCDICGKGFGQAYFLRVHELTHWSVKRYNCTLCDKSFTHYSNAKNHSCSFLRDNEVIQSKRRVKPSLSYTCHICKNTFFQLQEFNSHIKAHTGAKLYRCLLCDKLFGMLSEFNTHRYHCNGTRGERDSPCCIVKNEETKESLQCSLPQNVQRRSSARNSSSPVSVNYETQKINSHMSLQSSQTQHKKPITGSKKPFQSTVIPSQQLSHLVSKLNKLDNRSDPRKYLCPNCGRLFRHMGRLRAHMLTHARGQSYTCGCCGKTLENWKKLWHHQRIHRQKRGRFTCPQCGQGFRFVGPYKRHVTEHPEFQWIEVRPKKVSLPYQCEQCSTSFRTLDLLFSHQLCHSSSQDMHKVFHYDLSIDDHNAHPKRAFSPPMNNQMTTFHPKPQQNNLSPSPSLQMDNPNEGPLSKYPDLVPPETVTISVVPLDQQQSLDSYQTVQQPSSPLLYKERETSPDGIEKDALGNQITTLKTAKGLVTQDAVKSNESEGSSDGIKCAVCGGKYSAISELYQHYLQHARGQL
ncbi:uncharacterized protein ACJ7VT_021003 [Polymixia lowei]